MTRIVLPAVALALALVGLGSTPSSAAETKCVASQGYVVVAREHTGEVGSDVIVRKARDTKVKGVCKIAAQKGDYVVLPKTNSSTFLAFQSGLLALDEGTGSQRGLTVIDVATRKEIATSLHYADNPPLGFVANASGMTFWQVGAPVKPAQCPAAWRAHEDNKSATKAHLAEETTIAYGPGATPKKTGRTDCTITEEDL